MSSCLLGTLDMPITTQDKDISPYSLMPQPRGTASATRSEGSQGSQIRGRLLLLPLVQFGVFSCETYKVSLQIGLHIFFCLSHEHLPRIVPTWKASIVLFQRRNSNHNHTSFDTRMSLNTSMETYLSLAAVLIMCVPGISFLVQIWRKRKAKQTRNAELLRICEARTLSSLMFCGDITRTHHPFCWQGGRQPALHIVDIRPTPYVNSIELVVHP